MSLPRLGVNHPVPVNLLMIGLLVGGLVAGFQLRREFFPEIQPEQSAVTLPYPGATPEEVEESLAIKVEEKLADLKEVKEISTTISEGGGGIVVEFREGTDPFRGLDEVERTLAALTDLPQDSEELRATLVEPRLPVIRVSVYGDLDEEVLKRSIRAVRDDLRSLPNMGEVVVEGVRRYEIRIDVDKEALLRYGVSLPRIAEVVRGWTAEIPGGTVRSQSGNVTVRIMGVEERAAALRRIPILQGEAGAAIRLGDVARISEVFQDEQVLTRYNRQSSASLTVFKVGKQDIVQMAESVRAYVLGRQGKPLEINQLTHLTRPHMESAWRLGESSARALPAAAGIQTNSDLARFVEGRLDLLIRNAVAGASLVFLTLLLFLSWRAAFWVGIGMVTAIAGTILLMSFADITLNLLTMFGLIIVVGILVDDGIVVAENIETLHARGASPLEGAASGAEQVAWPVVATVMTTVVAFVPLAFIQGRIGDLMGALPWVVACALLMSLVESVFILPSHMGHGLVRRDAMARPNVLVRGLRAWEAFRDRVVWDNAVWVYGKLLDGLLRYRYVTLAGAVATLILSLGLVAGKRVIFEFLPSSDAETLIVDFRMPIGTAMERTTAAAKLVEDACFAQPETLTVTTVVGQRTNIEAGTAESFAPHVAQMFIELHPTEKRERAGQRTSKAVIQGIRAALEGKLTDVDRIRYGEIQGGPGGTTIAIQLLGDKGELHQIEAAAADLKAELSRYDGIVDLADDNDIGQLELQVRLKPGAAALGFTSADVARQLRGYLFGIDAHVYAAENEDIDIRVRIDETTRRSLTAMENSWVISPAGRPVPLSEIADVEESSTYSTIKRVDRKRAITVSADVRAGVSPEEITRNLPAFVDQLRAKYPTVEVKYAGRQQQQIDAFASLPYGILAAFVMIYVILAWLFSSYIQPVVVMMAIPFGIIGVIWGHYLIGYNMTFLSVIGFVALSGIVVNDSLILVQFYNERRQRGASVHDALVAAGRARLRAIFLTTVTTVLGLLPLLMETSFQARFLIPMAISISMGLLSATVLVLVALPCLLAAMHDARRLLAFLWNGRWPVDAPPVHHHVAEHAPPVGLDPASGM